MPLCCTWICDTENTLLVGCHNMLLDSHGTLKIADFAGSSVARCRFPASVDYEVGSKLPGEVEPTIRTDIFALGSAVYEMMCRKVPYKGRPHTEVQRLFKQHRFPDDFPTDFDSATGLRLIVEKCWGKDGNSYATVDEVLAELNALRSSGHSLQYAVIPKTSIFKVVDNFKAMSINLHRGTKYIR